MTGTNRDFRPWLLLLSAAVLALDRLTKMWVASAIPLGGAIPVIPRVFRITHVLNTGAAFSLFADSVSPERVRWILVAFSVTAAIVVAALIFRLGRRFTWTTLALALILGGALGNLYDRVHYSFVLDFLEVHIIHYHWPDFNVADSAIVAGSILLVLDALRGGKADEPQSP